MNYTTETLIFVLERMSKLLREDIDSIERYTIKDIVYSIKQRLLAAENLVDVVRNEGSSVKDFEKALDKWDRS